MKIVRKIKREGAEVQSDSNLEFASLPLRLTFETLKL
jgi:hypothetical protein